MSMREVSSGKGLYFSRMRSHCTISALICWIGLRVGQDYFILLLMFAAWSLVIPQFIAHSKEWVQSGEPKQCTHLFFYDHLVFIPEVRRDSNLSLLLEQQGKVGKRNSGGTNASESYQSINDTIKWSMSTGPHVFGLLCNRWLPLCNPSFSALTSNLTAFNAMYQYHKYLNTWITVNINTIGTNTSQYQMVLVLWHTYS